jgi:hypothetical protein
MNTGIILSNIRRYTNKYFRKNYPCTTCIIQVFFEILLQYICFCKDKNPCNKYISKYVALVFYKRYMNQQGELFLYLLCKYFRKKYPSISCIVPGTSIFRNIVTFVFSGIKILPTSMFRNILLEYFTNDIPV